MTFSFYVENDSNFLTISSDAIGLGYVGAASVIGIAGRQTKYRVYCEKEPIVFVELQAGVVFSAPYAISAGSGAWDIFIQASTAGTRRAATPTRVDPNLHVFAPLSGPGAGGSRFIFRLYDALGNRTFDMDENMLQPKDFIGYPAASPPVGSFGDADLGIKALSRPAVFCNGASSGAQRIARVGGGVDAYSYDSAYWYQGSNLLTRTQICNSYEIVRDLPPAGLVMRYGAQDLLLIDLADY